MIGNLQQQQAGFSAFKANERLQPQISALTGIDGAPQLPDFSSSNQFGGNPFNRGSGAGGNPFALSPGAASAAAALPAFGGMGGGGSMGGGNIGSVMGQAAQKIAASADKLTAAIEKLTSALTGGGGPGAPGRPGPGAPGRRMPRGSAMQAGMSFAGNALGAIANTALGINSIMMDQQGFALDSMGLDLAAQERGQAMGGMGNFHRQNTRQKMIKDAMRDSSGHGMKMGGQIGMGLGALALGAAAFIAAPITGGTSLLGLSALGLASVGGAAAVGGSVMMSAGDQQIRRDAQKARDEGMDANDPRIQAATALDKKEFVAQRSRAIAGTTSVAGFFSAMAQFPGGEGADAIYRGAANNRVAMRARVTSEIGMKTMIPMEQAALGHLANITVRADRQSAFTYSAGGRIGLATGGMVNGKIRNGLFGGEIEENMTDFTGLMGQALGISALQGSRSLQSIVSGQGFRGIAADALNGYSTIANPNLTRAEIVKQFEADGVNKTFNRPPRMRDLAMSTEEIIRSNMRDQDTESLAERRAAVAANLSGASTSILSSKRRTLMSANLIGDPAADMALALFGASSGVAMGAQQNARMGLTEIIAARQMGFSDQTIGMAASSGRGGMNGGFMTGAQLIAEANFLGLRGGAAQQHIQGRIGFGAGLAQRGINLREVGSNSGFAFGTRGEIQILQNGQATGETIVQEAFTSQGNQLMGEINTIINRGRAAGLSSFGGANFQARAQELMQPSGRVLSKLGGLTGGFASDMLMSALLLETDGNISQARGKAETMGPLGALKRLRAIGGNDRRFLMDAMTDMGFSFDTARMAIDSPMELQNLPGRSQRANLQLMSTTAAGIQAEAETQRAQRFDAEKFRTLKMAEMLKENGEATKLSIDNIFEFLKTTFGPQKKKKKPTPPPAPPTPPPPTPPPPPPSGPMGPMSDIRLKKDIKQLYVSDMGLNVYEFRYNELYTNDETLWIGVMAQDVLNVKPEAVFVAENGYYGVNYDLLDVDMIKAEERK